MHSWFDVPVLEGSLVRLEPLSTRHAEDLAAAAEDDRGSYDFALVPRASEVGGYLTAQLARTAQGLVPFAQIRQADGRTVGCTAYWDPRYWPGRDDLIAPVWHLVRDRLVARLARRSSSPARRLVYERLGCRPAEWRWCGFGMIWRTRWCGGLRPR